MLVATAILLATLFQLRLQLVSEEHLLAYFAKLLHLVAICCFVSQPRRFELQNRFLAGRQPSLGHVFMQRLFAKLEQLSLNFFAGPHLIDSTTAELHEGDLANFDDCLLHAPLPAARLNAR